MNSYEIIKQVVENLFGENETQHFSLDRPENSIHGDYSTNIALVSYAFFSRSLGGRANEGIHWVNMDNVNSPRDLAEKLCLKLSEDLVDTVEKIEVAGPGFINFFLKDDIRTDEVDDIANGVVVISEPQGKAMVEYTDPNCFKVFHIGHLMSNTIGEAVSRIYETKGYNVTRVCYPSDIGRNVAMGVWGVMQKEDEKPSDSASLKDKVSFLGMCYAFANEQYETNEEAKKGIISVNKAIYDGTDAKVMEVYAEGRALSLEYFDYMYARLGTKFDAFIFESEVAEPGLKIVQEYLQKGLFEESEGAIVYKGEQDGLHTRVFITAQGLPTYEAKDLGNYEKKLELIGDASSYVVITANEQNEYFKVVNKVTEKIHPELKDKLVHIGHGMMRLPGGKMSSRTGNVIGGEDMLDQIIEKLQEKLGDKLVSFENASTLLNDIAVGAIKFSILKQSPGGDIIFDFDKSISFEGDSGPYLQYTHARICTLLDKAESLGITMESYVVENGERELEQVLIGYGQVLEKAYKDLGPHHIVQYLLSLTRAFNAVYGRKQFIDENNKEESAYYVMLSQATKNILAHGLHILGISAPTKM